MGNAIAAMTGFVFFVEHSIGNDMSRIDVAQQRIVETIFIMEAFQHFQTVIRHRSHVYSQFGKPLLPLCQLDQLALTEGSPVGRTVQKQQQTLFAAEVIQLPQHAILIERFQHRQLASCRRSPVVAVFTTGGRAEQDEQWDHEADFQKISFHSLLPSHPTRMTCLITCLPYAVPVFTARFPLSRYSGRVLPLYVQRFQRQQRDFFQTEFFHGLL